MDIDTLPARQVLGAHEPETSESELAWPDLDGVMVLRVRGEIDLYTGPELREALRALLAPPAQDRDGRGVGNGVGSAADSRALPEQGSTRVRAVVVDLGEVTFLDSFAMGVLVQGHRWARPGGQAYAVVATLGTIHMMFDMTGLAKVMPLHPDVATAVRQLRPATGRASA